MSVLTSFLPVTLACALLAGCVTVTEAARSREVTPMPVRNGAVSSATLVDPAAALAPANLGFRILNASAKIGSREYVLDLHNRPVITTVGEHTYRLDLPLRRDSKSSLRGDETLSTHFYYDGVELIFFGDKNRNQRFDRHEAGVRHVIDHTRELVSQGGRRYVQPRRLDVSLQQKHLSSPQRVHSLTLQLMFQQ